MILVFPKCKTTNHFEKDLAKAQRQNKNIERLQLIVDLLSKKEKLPAVCRPHKLSGTWDGYWECHIGPNWLLIYYYKDGVLHLTRMGSHSELF